MLLHIAKWDGENSKYVFFNRDGSQTTSRDEAELWTDPVEAEAAAKKFGGCVVIFDNLEDTAIDEADDRG